MAAGGDRRRCGLGGARSGPPIRRPAGPEPPKDARPAAPRRRRVPDEPRAADPHTDATRTRWPSGRPSPRRPVEARRPDPSQPARWSPRSDGQPATRCLPHRSGRRHGRATSLPRPARPSATSRGSGTTSARTSPITGRKKIPALADGGLADSRSTGRPRRAWPVAGPGSGLPPTPAPRRSDRCHWPAEFAP
jgi:hypothetical protein